MNIINRLKGLQIFFAVLLVGLTAMAVAADNKKNTRSMKGLDRIVAIVGDSVITQSQLNQRMLQVEEHLLRRNLPVPSKKVLEAQVLQQIVDQQLILQVAEQMNITISDEQLNEAITQIAQRNQLSLSQFKSALEAQGMNYEEYRAQVRKEMIIAEAQNNVVGTQVRITDQEIENALEQSTEEAGTVPQYHLLDILIPLPETPSPDQLQQAQRKATEIINVLKTGASFQETAVAQSSGTFALKGGDLGWREAAQLPALFAQAVQQMKTGDISPPLRAPNGLHILKLAAIRNGQVNKTVKEYNVRQILLRVTPQSESDQKVKAQMLSIRKQIQNGADFATMAKKYSQGPNAQKGGDIGWISVDVVVPEFADAMTKLKKGQISQPFKTGNGWHMIEVLGTRNKDETRAFREKEIKRLIYQRKFEEGIQKWVEQLRETTYIKLMLTPAAPNKEAP